MQSTLLCIQAIQPHLAVFVLLCQLSVPGRRHAEFLFEQRVFRDRPQLAVQGNSKILIFPVIELVYIRDVRYGALRKIRHLIPQILKISVKFINIHSYPLVNIVLYDKKSRQKVIVSVIFIMYHYIISRQ
jgi:hypothetical protein